MNTLTDQKLAAITAGAEYGKQNDGHPETREFFRLAFEAFTELKALRAQLAELRGQAKPICIVEESDYLTADEMVGNKPRRKAVRELFEGALVVGDELFSRPVPPAENILFEPEPTDSANSPLKFSPEQDTAWVVGAEWMREEFKKANKHLKLTGDDDHYPQTVSQPVAWQWFYLKQWHVTNDPERARDVAEGGVEVQPLGVCSASQPSYRDGIEAAAKWIDQQREAFDNEHGQHDPDTGTFEFVNDAQLEYSSTLAELAEGIRALHPAPASQPYTVPDELSGKSFEYIANKFQVSLSEAQWILVGWNACRAAMLQSGNSPVVLDGSVPEGYALVPSTIYLDESDIESICSQCGDGGGNYGDFTRGILWVGNIQDDEGNITHGLHISSDDYPEEGGITLAEFAAAPQHKGE